MIVKLSKDNIAFIDRYLENSGVIYADIRVEMVDHVASEIESEMENGDDRPFYELFKDYMSAHKRQLMDNKRCVILSVTKRLIMKVLRSLYSPVSMVLFLITIIAYYGIINWLGLNITRWVFLLLALGMLLIPYVFYEYKMKKHGIPRFSGIERLGICITITTQFVFLLFNSSLLRQQEDYSLLFSVLFALMNTICIAFLEVGIKQYNLYKGRTVK